MHCLFEPFNHWPVDSIMKSQVAGYKKFVVPVFLQISVCCLAKL